MVRFIFTFFIAIILFAYSVPAQNTAEISSKQNELKNIKNEITSLEKEITIKSKKEKETFGILQNYDRQSYLLNKVIGQYRKEEKEKSGQIVLTEQKIQSLTAEILQLQNNYAKYVNAVYRKRQKSDLALIFDAESISQAVRRLFYLKKFSERRERDLIKFERAKEELLSAKNQLEKEKEEKSLLIEKKVGEEKILANKTTERKQILNALRKDKIELKKVLDAKKKAEVAIRNLITRLNEEQINREKELKEKLLKQEQEKLAVEKKRKETLTEKKILVRKKVTDENIAYNFSAFEKLKGQLSWPVSNGKIIRKFGENKNFVLNTVTLNYGVDIKASSDLKVKAVSNGIVSAMEWIPGYGSIMIISHSGEYRSVYGHLGEIYVQEGDIVNSGQQIALLGESIDGYVLHFEIWNSRENQNPEIWLAKK
jgi:septal ring factor EnvC (AmiA/AmiB activator)